MNEELLQYIWKHRLYIGDDLKTTDGETLEILNPGEWNGDSGPDFFNASIKIGETIWAGNVEIHLRSSDWNRHGHQNNDAFNNTILHVVIEKDEEALLSNKEPLPTLELKISTKVEATYTELINQKRWPACADKLSKVDEIYKSSALSSLMIERLEQKTDAILHSLHENKNNWNETFYHYLAHNFGFKTNAVPFELVARSLPLSVLAKHKSNLFQIEALLFGQSGLLNESLLGDDYFLSLRNEYAYLASKYNLKGIEMHLWKFMRLRPLNFPTIRIAQFASLIHKSEALFSKIIEIESINQLQQLFSVGTSTYWDNHYRFNAESEKIKKRLGDDSQSILIVNTVIPLLFVYGESTSRDDLKNRALTFLEEIPSENNSIISRWHELGFRPQNAFDTQALIQLKTNYCDHLKCLKCQIGSKIIVIE